MKVFRGSSRRKQSNVLGLGNSRDVTTERVRVLDEVGAGLGAKDAMHQVGSVGVRHAEMVIKDSGCHGDRHFGHVIHIPHGPPPEVTVWLRPLISFVGWLILAKAAAGFLAGWGLLQRGNWARIVA